MKVDLQNLFLVLGLVQGLAIAFVSIYRKRSPSSWLFAGTIMVLCLLISNNLYFFTSFQGNDNTILDFVIWEPVLLMGPFVFLYGRSLFEKDFQWKRKHLWHLVPSFLDFLPAFVSIIVWTFDLFEENQNYIYSILNRYDDYIVIPQFLSLSAYLIASWTYLIKIKPLTDNKTYRWFRDFLMGLSLIDLIWLPFLIIYVSSFQLVLLESVYFHPVFYPMCAFLYYLSIRIMMSGMTFRPNPYSREELDANLDLINQAITRDNLYRDPDLNLKKLSGKVRIQESMLSFIFRHYYKKGFNQFINEYRINAALEKIRADEIKKLSMEGIALEVGFASRSTFYRAFKNMTGKHPTDLIQED